MSRKSAAVSKRGRGDAGRLIFPFVATTATTATTAATTTTTAATPTATAAAVGSSVTASLTGTSTSNRTTRSKNADSKKNKTNNTKEESQKQILKLLDTIRGKDKTIHALRSQNAAKDKLIQRLSKALQTERENKHNGYIPILPLNTYGKNVAAASAAAPPQNNESPSTQTADKESPDDGSNHIEVGEENGTSSSRKRKRQTKNKKSSSTYHDDKETAEQAEWDEMIRQLKVFKDKHNTCIVPRSHTENPKLVRFVENNQNRYRQIQAKTLPESSRIYKILTPGRIQELNDMGFNWSMDRSTLNDKKWNIMFDALKEFKDKTGHTRVPTSYNASLSNWVTNQRSFFKNAKEDEPVATSTSNSTITNTNSEGASSKEKREKSKCKLQPDRIARLQLMGFEWMVANEEHKASWDARFQDLISFKLKYGHCRVPREYKDNRKLGNWVKEQRRLYKRMEAGKQRQGLTDDRIKRLEQIGFEWRILQHALPVVALQEGLSVQERQMMKDVDATAGGTPTPRWGEDARTDASGPSRYGYLYENY